jgi:AcrR family transcriptional regulator
MPRTEEQYEEIRESRKAQIMETALELFASGGYHETPISKIASKAGISKGLMYNYFSSKEELIKEIIHEGVKNFLKSFDPDHDGYLTDDEFKFYVEENFRILKENIPYWKLYFAVMMQPPVHKLVHETYADLAPGLTPVLVNYFRRKRVSDPELEAEYFGSILDGASLNYIVDPDVFPLEKIKKLIIDKFSYNDLLEKK